MMDALVPIAWSLAKYLGLLGIVMGIVPVLTWMERRQSALMQDRIGPNRANIGRFRAWGLFHPIADGIKMFMKEDFIPAHAHKPLFTLAPIVALAPVLIVLAVIPYGPGMQAARLDVGLLFLFGVLSLSVYGATLAGWASYNKWAMLGGLRASAQMISYEVTMGMAALGALMIYGTLEPGAMVEAQRGGFCGIGHWGIFRQPLGFVLFTVAAIAETKRAPFDLPEGEPEILGYFVEYSGMRFGMFFMGEFAEVVVSSAVITTLYLGGWIMPWDSAVAVGAPHALYVAHGVAMWVGKVFVLCALQLALRWTLPRLRYDQLMRLGWKQLLPASLANVLATAVIMVGTK
ncbi:MAG: NADH-quinone oxidoreductase subunit NuoH [Myxococcota bacterium]